MKKILEMLKGAEEDIASAPFNHVYGMSGAKLI